MDSKNYKDYKKSEIAGCEDWFIGEISDDVKEIYKILKNQQEKISDLERKLIKKEVNNTNKSKSTI